MKKIFNLLLSTLFLSSCASPPVKLDQVRGSYSDNLKNLNLNNSFAFSHNSDTYYFAARYINEGEYNCYFYLGFKNDELKYSFPAHCFSELDRIYEQKTSVEEKKVKALQKIDEFKFENQKCTKEIARKEKTANDVAGEAIYFLIFAPFIPLAVVFGGDILIQSAQDSLLENQLSRIRLGMTLNQVNDLIQKPFIYRKLDVASTDHYEFYQLDYRQWFRLVLFFKNGKLDAYARGLRGKNDIQP